MEEPEEEQIDSEPPERVVVREDVRAAFCRRLALRTLARFGIAKPPVPVEAITERMGFQIRVCLLPPGVNGRLVIEGSNKIIEVAAGQARVRLRFTIAHELGHHLLGHRHGESKTAERQADVFAGALLAPGSWLRRDLRTLRTLDALADHYQVSREVITIAASGAGLLNELR